MKQLKIIVILVLIIAGGCSKDKETFTTYPVPDWSIQAPEQLPHSFTAIVAVPENINIYATDGDKVAAFINEECRGVGTLVKSENSGSNVYYITIRASDTENGLIVFRYYNARLSYLYQATQSIPFEIDGTFGTYDSPVIMELENL